MSETLNYCPVCNKELEVNEKTSGDYINYRCPNHGEFNLSRTLSTTVVRNPKWSKNVADYLENNPSVRKDVICTQDVGVN